MYFCSLHNECKNAGNISSLCALTFFKNSLCLRIVKLAGQICSTFVTLRSTWLQNCSNLPNKFILDSIVMLHKLILSNSKWLECFWIMWNQHLRKGKLRSYLYFNILIVDWISRRHDKLNGEIVRKYSISFLCLRHSSEIFCKTSTDASQQVDQGNDYFAIKTNLMVMSIWTPEFMYEICLSLMMFRILGQ